MSLAVRLLFVFAALLGGPASAHAHAVLLSAEPKDGARLEQAPRQIALRFNEPVTPIAVRVLDASGAIIAGAVTAENDMVRVALPGNLPPGRYVVSYRVISADSHAVTGAVLFAVGDVPNPPANAPPVMASDAAVGWTVAYGVGRGIFYAALLLAAGGFLFRRLVARGETDQMPSRTVSVAATVAIVAAFFAVGLKGAQLAAAPLGGLFDPAIWRLGASTTLGTSALAGIAGLALLLAASRASALAWLRGAGWLGAIAACASVAMTGHAATASPRWLTTPAVVMHLLAAAFWIGALLPLRRALALPPSQAASLLRRFSQLAVGAVALLLAAGGALVVVQVETVAGLLETDYGWILIYKLVFVATLLAVAALNKLRWTPRLAAGDAAAKPALRRLLNLDLGLAFAVVAATSALGQVPPPRALHAHDGHDHQHDHRRDDQSRPQVIALASPMGEGRVAVLEVSPARAGRNRLTVAILDSAGKRIRPLEIAVELSLPSADLGPLVRKLARDPAPDGDGRFVLDDDALSLWGRWTVEVHVLLTEFNKSIVSFDLFVH